MKPCHYPSERNAARYAADLNAAFPKSIGLRFDAIAHAEGFTVRAIDSQSRQYLVTPRPARLSAVNFINYEGATL